MTSPIEFSTFPTGTPSPHIPPKAGGAIPITTSTNVTLDFDFSVNPDNLEYEWVSLPLFVFNASKMLADDRFSYEELKRQAQVVRADMDMAVRRNPAKFGLDKVTEGTVAAIVNAETQVQDADRRALVAKKVVDTAQAAVAAMSAKKDALNAIVDMKKMNYYNTR